MFTLTVMATPCHYTWPQLQQVDLPLLTCLPWLQVPDLVHIYLVGFYEEKEFQLYVSALSTELKVPVR
jgi:hypothetical protein